jgi:CTP synthase
MVMYIITTGGVISGVGKGIITSSLGLLLKKSNKKITAIKIDPYVNVDAGTISPIDHGEVFVLQDGSEVDLDLGNYERFLDINLTKDNCITTGKVYQTVIENERKGNYLGKTVQIVPHVTNVIMDMITTVSKGNDICLIEVGGTVGDIESLPFLEALRQLKFKVGLENFHVLHVSLIPCVNNEQKSKPTQSSVKTLCSLGLNPNIILCRSESKLDTSVQEKISMFCNLPKECVLSVVDCETIYQVPKLLFDQNILELLGVGTNDVCKMKKWDIFVESVLDKSKPKVIIGIFGKYTSNHDAYISLKKAVEHACYYQNIVPDIKIIDCSNAFDKDSDYFLQFNGIIIPGGFGNRGTDEKMKIIQMARTLKIPFLGICLGFQLAVVEFANNVCDLKTNSDEFCKNSGNIIVDVPENKSDSMGGTMKLGNYTTSIKQYSLAFEIYNKNEIIERHRHRYEVDTQYNEILEKNGMIFSGRQKQEQYKIQEKMHVLELDQSIHPFFVATQFHPEFNTKPLEPAPIFVSFVKETLSGIFFSKNNSKV